MREEPTRARGPSGAIHLPFSALSVLSQRRLPQRQAAPVGVISRLACQPPGGFRGTPSPVEATKLRRLSRSEERRVGKECRSWWVENVVRETKCKCNSDCMRILY